VILALLISLLKLEKNAEKEHELLRTRMKQLRTLKRIGRSGVSEYVMDINEHGDEKKGNDFLQVITTERREDEEITRRFERSFEDDDGRRDGDLILRRKERRGLPDISSLNASGSNGRKAGFSYYGAGKFSNARDLYIDEEDEDESEGEKEAFVVKDVKKEKKEIKIDDLNRVVDINKSVEKKEVDPKRNLQETGNILHKTSSRGSITSPGRKLTTLEAKKKKVGKNGLLFNLM
jgi:hypothetical protein